MPRNFSIVDRFAPPSSVSRGQRHLLLNPNQRLSLKRTREDYDAITLDLVQGIADLSSNGLVLELNESDRSDPDESDDEDGENDRNRLNALRQSQVDVLLVCEQVLEEKLVEAQRGPRFVRIGLIRRPRNNEPIRSLSDALRTWGEARMEERVGFRVEHFMEIVVHLGFADPGSSYESQGILFSLEGGRLISGAFVAPSALTT